MSPLLADTEAKWLAQYGAMRQTLAELRMEHPNDVITQYGQDIVLGDEDLMGTSSLDDLWDMFSDNEQDAGYNSDTIDNLTVSSNGKPKSSSCNGQSWLRSKCLAYTTSKPGVDAEKLQQKLSAMMASDLRGLHVRFLLWPEIKRSYR